MKSLLTLAFFLLLASCAGSTPHPEDACGGEPGKHSGDDIIAACTKRIDATQGEERAVAYAGRAHAEVRFHGDAKAALADYDSALKLSPGFHEALRGRFYVRFFLLRDLSAALADSAEMLRRAPADGAELARHGRVLYCAGKYAEAAKALADSLEQGGPEYERSESILWLAISRARLRDARALSELKKQSDTVAGDSPDRPAVDLFLGKLGAEAMLKESDKRTSLRCGSRLYAGDWYGLHGKLARAKELWAEARDHCPPNAYNRIAATMELDRTK